jgi:phosphatidylglycerophosphatase A
LQRKSLGLWAKQPTPQSAISLQPAPEVFAVLPEAAALVHWRRAGRVLDSMTQSFLWVWPQMPQSRCAGALYHPAMSENALVCVPPAQRVSLRWMRTHPAHIWALGFGVGLSPRAPGTLGTLWAWLVFVVLQPVLNDWAWAGLIGLAWLLGWWASAVAAKSLCVLDPCAVVCDEIVAFWLVLWLLMPASWWEQALAFALFRFFDAVKPGPVGWADRLFHHVDPHADRLAWPKAALGIMLDDVLAAACTLLLLALWRFAT